MHTKIKKQSRVKLTHWWSSARKPLVCLYSIRNVLRKLSLHHLMKVSELKIAKSLKVECENELEGAPQGLIKLEN